MCTRCSLEKLAGILLPHFTSAQCLILNDSDVATYDLDGVSLSHRLGNYIALWTPQHVATQRPDVHIYRQRSRSLVHSFAMRVARNVGRPVAILSRAKARRGGIARVRCRMKNRVECHDLKIFEREWC